MNDCSCKDKNYTYYVNYYDENMTAYGGYCDWTDDLEEAKAVVDNYKNTKYIKMVCAGVYCKETNKIVYAVGEWK